MISQELYWTHTYPLLQTLINVQGDILELGCGHYSTAIVAAFNRNRRVVSVDHDEDWLGDIKKHYKHECVVAGPSVKEWVEGTEQFTKHKWGVVFVDHGHVPHRGEDLLRFKNCAEVILMHDSHLDNPDDGYNSFEAIQSFKYFKEHSLYWPQTAVMSETNNLEWLQ